MNKEQPTRAITDYGTQYWAFEGYRYHRLDGPAIIYEGSNNSLWYVDDVPTNTTQLELSVGLSINWGEETAVVIKQINYTLFQVLLGNQKIHLFSLYNTEYKNTAKANASISYASPLSHIPDHRQTKGTS